MRSFPKIASMFTSFIEHSDMISLVSSLPGYNWRCIYCRTYEVILDLIEDEVRLEDLRCELENNKLINPLIVSGGEPTIHDEKLVGLLKFIKASEKDEAFGAIINIGSGKPTRIGIVFDNPSTGKLSAPCNLGGC